ncbi:MAG: tetratricopeptide repeat-containing sensor histidine kinase [Janthinobacterium lividum]
MKCWVFSLLAAGLLHSRPLAAQTRAADSLRTLLKAASRPDTTRVRRLRMLARELMASDLPQTIKLLEEALTLCRQIPDPAHEGYVLIPLATTARLRNDNALARRYTQQAKVLFTQRNDWNGLGKTYLQLSIINSVQGDYTSAIRAALQGIPFSEKAHDLETQIQLQATLGGIYAELGNYTEALPVLRATLKNARAFGDNYVEASTLNQLGKSYRTLENWPLALNYFQQSARLNRKLHDMKSATTDEINISELYAQQGNNAQALQHGLAARSLARANQDSYNLPGAELALAKVYLATQQLDSSIWLAQHGFSLSETPGGRNRENLSNASNILAQAYAQRRDFAQAYQYQKLWVNYRDSLSGEEIQRKTATLLYHYELDKKQSRIAVLGKEKQLQHQQLIGLLIGLSSTILVVGLLWRNVYLKQRTNRVLNAKSAEIAAQRDDLNRTLLELKATQSQLVQSEKMVALAALTAGVAHEIQNPLNFVNNFAEVSVELVAELEEEEQRPVRDPALEAALLVDLKQNLRKIHQHGARAGDIVKGMLEHARADAGQRQPIDLNAVAQDYLRLAYHDLQTKHRTLAVARPLDLDRSVGLLELVPQEIGRVLLNLFTNAFYAVHQKATQLGPAYAPEVRVSTRRQGGQVELRIRDNGTGIPAAVVEKIYNPFFTTKPAGEGTGLGLWFSYDIITKGYGGTLTVSSQEGEYTEFVVTLPLAKSV